MHCPKLLEQKSVFQSHAWIFDDFYITAAITTLHWHVRSRKTGESLMPLSYFLSATVDNASERKKKKKHAYKYTHTHEHTHTCEYIYRVRWGKRPLRGKRPPSCSSLITYLFIPVSWSGYLHHLLVLFCINNLVEASQGSGHVFFSFEHIPCKCSVLSVVGWTGIFLWIVYIMAKCVGPPLLARDPLNFFYSLQFARNGPTTTVHQDLIGTYVTTES